VRVFDGRHPGEGGPAARRRTAARVRDVRCRRAARRRRHLRRAERRRRPRCARGGAVVSRRLRRGGDRRDAAALGEARGGACCRRAPARCPRRGGRLLPLPWRPWLYGILLGLGFTTFVLTSAVWALADSASRSADPGPWPGDGLGFGNRPRAASRVAVAAGSPAERLACARWNSWRWPSVRSCSVGLRLGRRPRPGGGMRAV